jgi:hypothetical protein
VLRGGERVQAQELEPATVSRTLRDGRLWRMCLGSGLYVYAQVAVIGYSVLFLHDEHGLSDQSAALVIAAAQVLAVALRIGAGRWSDVRRARAAAGRARLRDRRRRRDHSGAGERPSVVARPVAWRSQAVCPWPGTGLRSPPRRSSPACGEAAPRSASSRRRSPGIGVLSPVVFAFVVGEISWPAAFAVAALFPLAGALALHPLAVRESAGRA